MTERGDADSMVIGGAATTARSTRRNARVELANAARFLPDPAHDGCHSDAGDRHGTARADFINIMLSLAALVPTTTGRAVMLATPPSASEATEVAR